MLDPSQELVLLARGRQRCFRGVNVVSLALHGWDAASFEDESETV